MKSGMRGRLSCLSPLTTSSKIFLNLWFPEFYANGEGKERISRAAYLQSTAPRVTLVHIRVPLESRPVLLIFDSTDLLFLGMALVHRKEVAESEGGQ